MNLPDRSPSVVLPGEIPGVGVVPHESEGGLPAFSASAAALIVRLDLALQNEIASWHRALSALVPPVGPALGRIAAELGCSPSTARKRYDLWRRNGRSELALAPRNVFADGAARVNGPAPEFVEWYQALCLEHNRSNRAAHREFVRRFHRGDLIPGLPVVNRRLLPRGFSESNLAQHAPTEFERVAARVGRKAASQFRPLVYTTRREMEVGHQYEVDDMWHDFKAVVLGQAEPVRLLELHALDVRSGCLFAHAVKPRLFDVASGKSVGLRENEFLFFLAWVLCQTGWHPAGTTIIGEMGTATIDAETEALLAEVTGGKVGFFRGVVDRRPAFGGAFTQVGKGNFRVKAALESLHNLAHNEMSHALEFPGQVGSLSRVNEPEGLAARERHQRWLLKAVAGLPAHVAAGIRHDFCEYNQAVLAISRFWEVINGRTDHDLEGFEEAGLTAVDWVSAHGIVSAQDYALATEEKREWVRNTHLPRARLLSPREVFDDGRGGLVRLRPEQAARLLSRVAGREVKVSRAHLVEFEDKELGPGVHRFAAPTWSPGDVFRAVVNPFWPEQLHLFNARGGWLGALRRHASSDRLDTKALEEARREAEATEHRLLGPVARAGAAQTRARTENATANAALVREFHQRNADEADETRAALRRLRAAEAVAEDEV
jgi:hypothetical protein